MSGSAKKSEAEAVLHRAVNDALHLLSLLRLVLTGLLHPCSCSRCLLCSVRRTTVDEAGKSTRQGS